MPSDAASRANSLSLTWLETAQSGHNRTPALTVAFGGPVLGCLLCNAGRHPARGERNVSPINIEKLAAAHRYNAACAAALAGTGQGKDLAGQEDTSMAELRYCALGWLQDDLSSYATVLPRLQPAGVKQLRQTLLHWQKDTDLAAVRDPESLRKLPEAEQVAWLNLWAQVDALLARTKPAK